MKFEQKPIFNGKWAKTLIVCFFIVIVITFLGGITSDATMNYYVRTYTLARQDTSFEINKEVITQTFVESKKKDDYGKIPGIVISSNDTVETQEDDVIFILNDLSSVRVMPKSKLIFNEIGEIPSVTLINGFAEIQTVNELHAYANNHHVILKQSGARININDDYFEVGNYYGSTRIEIKGDNNKNLLTYIIPLKKSIRIYADVNKDNWPNIRYSKLNKELHISSIKDELRREIFLPSEFSITVEQESQFIRNIRKKVTITEKRKIKLDENNKFSALQEAVLAVGNKAPSMIQSTFKELKPWKNDPLIKKLKNLLPSITDPITRYYTENAIEEMLGDDISSIDIELKYFYSIWQMEKTDQEKEILSQINKKIDLHKTSLNKLEEDYNLVTSFIEVYPNNISREIIEVKNKIENYHYQIVKTTTEKIDVILSTFDKSLFIISHLIENNNGILAQFIYSTMLINTVNYNDPFIEDYRKLISGLENEVKSLMNFYKEKLHSASFNKEVFEDFKKVQEKEKEAVLLFQKERKTIEKIRKKIKEVDFSSIVNTLNKYSIITKKDNIMYLLTGGNLLYVKEAELNLGKKMKSETTFNFIYDPDNKIISQVIWNKTDVLPPMTDSIPLENFQEAYNHLLEKSLTPETKLDRLFVNDWLDLAGVSTNLSDDLDYQIKRRITKQKLSEYNISSKENKMYMYGRVMEVKDSYIETKVNENPVVITFDIRLNVDKWDVLSLQMEKFPNNKARVYEIKDVSDVLNENYRIELARLDVQENAKSYFDSITKGNVNVTDFNIKDLENEIVTYKKLPIFMVFSKTSSSYKQDEEDDELQKEIIYRISGDLNNKTKLISLVEVDTGDTVFELKNIPVESLMSSIEAEIEKTKKDTNENNESESKNIDTVNSKEEAEAIIENIYNEDKKTSEEGPSEKKEEEYLDDGDWI